jgi:conjugative transfer signal peptidase TraF
MVTTRFFARAAVFIVAVCAIMFFGADRIYLKNNSDSMNTGFYLRFPIRVLRHGDVVELCLPPAQHELAKRRHYLGSGPCSGQQALVKEVAALPGDTVTVLPKSICINGMAVAASFRWRNDNRTGAVIPAIAPATYTITPGYVWVQSPKEGAWDSRYFGPIESRYVLARLVHIGEPPWPIRFVGRCRAQHE